MIADPEDMVMLLIACAPFVALLYWLLKPKSKKRIAFVVISLALFVILLPYTTLYIGAPVAESMPWIATSPLAGKTAQIILPIAFVASIILIGFLCFKALKNARNHL
ncbi:hypothetical protein A2881_04160 [Candidatus Peribacteria bacterium RIFCSPHIGHO2_01_FULL_55_13]|nr:MAG: hypothetical protein A2881_04160 [Candidatus Peribacteria bacterium RIFCSPHIGHO2_01_FULL_55_13]OGJ66307.1 MAG: hypothetical protein A3F36_02760 [Candidatus Peribacteria bacterium RIFCSPHIGHO2_12_FULL_55_11]